MNGIDTYCGGYGFWGPSAQNEDRFIDPKWNETLDFSTCFEETVFTLVPTLFVILFGILRIWVLTKRSSLPPPNSWLYRLKVMLMLFLVLETFSYMVTALYSQDPDFRIVSPAIQCFGYVFALIVMYYERKKNIMNSGVQVLFFFIWLLVDIIRMRTFILQSNHHHDSNEYVTFYGVHFTLNFFSLCFALMSDLPSPEYQSLDSNPCPEQFASFFSVLSFGWITKLMITGHKRPLVDDDLFNIMPEDQAKRIATTFEHAWGKQVRRGRDKASISKALASAFGGTFAAAALFKAIQDVLGFVQPQLLNYLIGFVKDPDAPTWHGYALAAGFLVNSVVQSICLHQYFHRVMKSGMRFRSALVTAIYKKSLVLSSKARQSTTSGEVVNLMAVDAQRFMDLTTYLNMIWSAPLQICLALYFLWQLMGVSTLAGVAVMILMVPLNGYIASKSKNYQKRQMKHKDKRIKLINEILNGIRVLKLYAWEKAFGKFVFDVRTDELVVLKASGRLNALSALSWSMAPFLVSLATFVTYSLTGHDLTAQTAFVSLALFNLLRFPLAMLPMLISALVEASVSVNRVRKFLLHEEMDPNNVHRDDPAMLNTFKDGNRIPALVVQNGTFAWDEETPVLKDVSFKVYPGTITAIVGRVGAGKSSIMSCLHGDMIKLGGTVVLPGHVAYVPQQAWIRNATLKDNILFGKRFDEKKYNHVLEVCALQDDLKQLPAGDMTEIGEKGINLSGGQKQRVSLARAVYQDADVYLFDDCLSAVDSHVGKFLFDNLLGPKGFLKKKARLLVTHALHVLSQTDSIVMLRDGTIIEQGTYSELMSGEKEFAKLIDEFAQVEKEEVIEEETSDELSRQVSQQESAFLDGDEDTRSNTGEYGDNDDDRYSRRPHSVATDGTAPVTVTTSIATAQRRRHRSHRIASSNSREKNINAEKTPLLEEKNLEKKKGDGDGDGGNSRLISTEVAQQHNVDWSVYKSYISAVGVSVALLMMLMYVITYSFQVGSSFWLSYWSAQDERHTNNPDFHEKFSSGGFLGVYAALGLGNSLGIMVSMLLLVEGAVRAAGHFHQTVLQHVLRSPMSFFDTTPMGRIVNRLSKDVYVIDEVLPRSFRSFMSTFMQVVSIVIVISVSTPIFMAAILPMGILYYYIQKFYVATSRQLKRLQSVSLSPIYSHFGETLSGVSSIRAYQREESFILENQQQLDTNLQAYYPSIASNRWLALRLEFLGNLVIFFAALFSVIDRHKINGGVVGLSLSYAMSVTQVLNWMVRMSSQLETDIVAIERLHEYSEIVSERPDIMLKRPSEAWPDKGVVSFNNYSVRYREGLDLVLHGINANVRSGEKVGIVGRTGAGKSSLTLCLFRILEAAEGAITIDGIDLSSIGLYDVRSRITIMPQDPVLFSGTVRRNLDPLELYADDKLWDALEVCHLKKKVAELEGKLDHEVSEGGDNFSVGERQLICLARAVLRKTKVLVLDEATAAVDLETDDLIQTTIRTVFKECTILTIAHRLNTILDSDRVMVLSMGELKEFDTPHNLFNDTSSIFYGMVKAAGINQLQHVDRNILLDESDGEEGAEETAFDKNDVDNE
eukprot:m.78839 g.78839  ORF g.78839 m.78839 type:complete len:1578 (-) comp8586_c0_seq2:145-4878(-)